MSHSVDLGYQIHKVSEKLQQNWREISTPGHNIYPHEHRVVVKRTVSMNFDSRTSVVNLKFVAM
jgi:hypothetical protein